jgi:hypothetical protein
MAVSPQPAGGTAEGRLGQASDDLLWPFQSSAATLGAATSGASRSVPLIIKCIKEQIEPFSHSGMGEYGVADLLKPKSAEHSHLQRGDDLTGVVAEQGRAQDEVGVGVHDGFPRAGGVVECLGPRDDRNRDLGDGHAAALGTRLSLGHSDPGQVRGDEDGVGHETTSGGRVTVVEVCFEDAEVVPRGVCELRTACDIAGGPDMMAVVRR